jgi:hypothetical protein
VCERKGWVSSTKPHDAHEQWRFGIAKTLRANRHLHPRAEHTAPQVNKRMRARILLLAPLVFGALYVPCV